MPEQKHNPVEEVDFIKKIQESKFDLILQMQGNGSYVNPLNELFNPKFLAGYYNKKEYCPNEELFMEYPDFGHEVERHLSLISFLGIPTKDQELEFPLSEKDYNDCQILDLGLPDKNFVCIHLQIPRNLATVASSTLCFAG
ncbi:MAG: hypothetical protein H7096_10275 [Flavobacterium sp.]|nr:hypothetical protein [Pedobacter sp.]